MEAASDFVVAWDSDVYEPTSAEDIHARRFTSSGGAVTAELVVVDGDGDSGFADDAGVAFDPDGGFMVAWTAVDGDDFSEGIFARRYTAANAPAGGAFMVNETTEGDQAGEDPQGTGIASNTFRDSTGVTGAGHDNLEFVVTWSGNGPGDDAGMFGRRYQEASAKCPGYEATPGNHIVGTAGNETLKGGVGIDVICGLGGRDVLVGLGGNDILVGGLGNDVLKPGPGADTVIGSAGIDSVVYTSTGNAVTANLTAGTSTGQGADSLSTVENLTGTSKADTFTGSSAANLLKGLGGADVLKGMLGNDTLNGGLGVDSLDGGGGTDTCITGGGADSKTSCEA
jgi:Ca2+-binding RTX toxin-like protein